MKSGPNEHQQHWPKGLLLLFLGFLLIASSCCIALAFMLLSSHGKMASNWWTLQGAENQEEKEIQARIVQIQKTMRHSRIRLRHLQLVLRENSELLPRHSHFGTFGPLSEICAGNDSARCVPAFRHLETRWRIAPKYGLIGCLVQKSLSTLLEAVLCLLFDEKRFRSSARGLHSEFSQVRLCRRQNEFGQLDRLDQAIASRRFPEGPSSLEGFTFFAILREPVERFLSGFVDKCVRQPRAEHFCLGCGTNLSCFVQAEYARMLDEGQRPRMQKSFEDRHFFPQNWRCNFRSLLANYSLLRVPDPAFGPPFPDRLMAFLVRHGVGQEVAQFLREQLDPSGVEEGRSLHSTGGTKVHGFFAERLRGSPFLMEFVVRMFWHDFRLLGFSIPNVEFG